MLKLFAFFFLFLIVMGILSLLALFLPILWRFRPKGRRVIFSAPNAGAKANPNPNANASYQSDPNQNVVVEAEYRVIKDHPRDHQ